MTQVTVKNLYSSPYALNTMAGTVIAEPGQSVTVDLSDGELKNVRENPKVWQFDGDDAAKVTGDSVARDAELTAARKLYSDLTPAATLLGVSHPSEFPGAIKVLADKTAALENLLASVRTDLGVASDDEVLGEINRLKSNNGSAGEFELKVREALGLKEGEGILEAIAALRAAPASTVTKTMTLAEAVAALDDKNDAHWIESGKPELAALSELTGAPVKRADVDALPAEQQRTRAK